MITQIKKRDGRLAPFNIEKIATAIYKSAQSVGGSDYNTSLDLAYKVTNEINKNDQFINQIPTVEQIQDVVEKILIENGHAKTAKNYILYRADRTRIREMNTSLMKIYEDLTFKSAAENDIKRENANIDSDTAMGTMLKYGSEGSKQFCEMFVLDPSHSQAHQCGDIHIHDLDFYNLTTTCCQIDLEKLFKNGFSTGHGFLREPTHIQSYSALACIAIQSNQNDQHGGQSVPNFDFAMALGVTKTYIRNYKKNLIKAIDLLCDNINSSQFVESMILKLKEQKNLFPKIDDQNYYQEELKLLIESFGKDTAKKIQDFTINNSMKEIDKDTYQAMEALVHNLNTMHSRAGAQIPFSSLNYGTDISPEGRLITKNLLLATEAGLGNGETPIFPIHIFKVKEGINFNPEDPNYDLFKLACRVSSKRLFPNFSFLDAPFNKKYYKPGDNRSEAAYMGCRTRVIANHYDKSKEIVSGRGNLSFTSINLPRLAINANKNIDIFFSDLDKKINLVIDQLLARFKIQSQKRVRNFPFLMGQGIWIDSDKLDIDDKIGEVLKHGTLTVGFIGLAECLKSLTGKHHGESEESQKLGLKIIGYMRKKTDEATEKYGLNFSLIATPAEGLSGRFVKIDNKKYGTIDGVTDRDYYTNSFHVPVYYKISAFDKIRLEAPYHELTNGGHITYIELDSDPLYNIEAFEKIIRYMKECNIGYGSINHPVDRDPVCGYTGIINNKCPKCGRTEEDGKPGFERIRRITGYLVGTLDRFNNAKKSEESQRVKHQI